MLASKLQIDCKCQPINPDIFGREANKPQAAWFYQRARQISWTDRRYHRYDLTSGGKICFGKIVPKKFKMFMNTLLRLLQRDFYIMSIITSIKTGYEMASFSSYLIIWSTVYASMSSWFKTNELGARSSQVEAVQAHFLEQWKYLEVLLYKKLYIYIFLSLNLCTQTVIRKGSFRMVKSIILCVLTEMGNLVIFKN